MQILGCLEADRWNDASAYPWTSISRSGICGWRFIAALSISIINNWLFSPIFLCFMAKAQLSIGARSVPVGAHSHLDPCNHASQHPCIHASMCISGSLDLRICHCCAPTCRWRWLYSKVQRVPTPTDKFVLESKPAPSEHAWNMICRH